MIKIVLHVIPNNTDSTAMIRLIDYKNYECLSDGKYGMVVSRLSHAKSIVESASKYELSSDTKVGRQKLMEAISLRLTSAIKDNESIYHYV